MLQRALASLLCLLGASSIGLGIASSTVWRASDTLVASAEAGQGSTLLLTEPGVLDMAAETVSVVATSETGDEVVLALGRSADVEAWVGEDPHTVISGLLDRETLSTEEGEPSEGTAAEPTPAVTDPAVTDPAATDPAATDPAVTDPAAGEVPDAAPNPAGSDLWVAEASGSGRATLEWTREDGRWSVLAATVAPDAGSLTMTLTWPQEVTTPWLVPGVAAGSVLLLAGLAWWAFLLLREHRAARWARVEDRTPSAPPVAAGPPVTAGPPVIAGPAAPATVGTAVPMPGALVGPRAGAAAPGTTPPGAIPVDVISGPLTRRQLRERERLAATGGIAQVPPGQPQPQPQQPQPQPQPQPPPQPARPQAAQPPSAQQQGAWPQDESRSQQVPPQGASRTAGTAGPVSPSAGAPAAPESGDAGSRSGESGNPLSRWGRRVTERGPRRAPTPTDPGPLSPKAGVPGELPASREPAVASGQASTVARPGPAGGRPAAAAAPSADLWRRAWGFPSAADADSPGQHPSDDRDEQDGEHR